MLRDRLIVAQSGGSTFNGFIGLNSSVTMTAYGVASDQNMYVVCGYENTSPWTGFLVSLDRSGSVNWQRKITKTGEAAIIYSVKIDSSGNVYAYADVGASLHLLKYNSAGSLQWQRKITSTSSVDLSFTSAQWLQIDSDGSVYLLVNHGTATREVVVLKYDSSGTLQWQKKYTRTSVALTPRDMTIDSSGNIYVGIGYGSSGVYEYTLRKLSSSGAEAAAVSLANTGWGTSYAGSVISSGSNIFVSTGYAFVIGPEITKLNSSLVYQSDVRMTGSLNYLFSGLGMASGSLVALTSDFNKYATIASTPDVTSLRSIDSSVGANEGLFGTCIDDNVILAAGRAYMTSASTFDAILMCLDPASDTGSYTPMTVANVTFSESSGNNRTTSTHTLTLSNSSLSDSAGEVTDVSGSYTVTLYSKV